jgi:small subunit ribosomal protein S16
MIPGFSITFSAQRNRHGVIYLMVRIRLRRAGGKKHPFYRVVIADQRAARDGSFIEQVGTYDPFPDPPEIKLDEEKITQWMKNGAQPSESVADLLRSKGLLPKAAANG